MRGDIMNVEKVLYCVALIGLAFAIAFGLTSSSEPGYFFELMGQMFAIFSLTCFSYIGIGRVAPVIIEKLVKYRARGRQMRSAVKKYANAKVDVPDFE